MKSLYLMAALAASTFASASAVAGPNSSGHHDIVVKAPTLEAWSSRVFNDLNRSFRYPITYGQSSPDTGIVAVKFNCSEDGSPSEVEVHKSSGNRQLDHATARAVQRIATLHPLPQGLGAGQKFIVRVLFAESGEDLKRKVAEMKEEAARANAWFVKGESLANAVEIAPVG